MIAPPHPTPTHTPTHTTTTHTQFQTMDKSSQKLYDENMWHDKINHISIGYSYTYLFGVIVFNREILLF